MKKLMVSVFIAAVLSGNAAGQKGIVATVKADNSVEVIPGINNRLAVTVTNEQELPMIDGSSKFTVTMTYKGSTSAGNSFNRSISIGGPIQPHKSRVYDITYTGPDLPGDYDVDVCLKWGTKIVSNVIHSTFTIEGVYDALITCKDLTLDVKRGGTDEIPLNFVVTNNGHTTWPEGKYSLHFELVSSPSGAGTYDKEAFKISPRTLEFWEIKPGESEPYDYKDFKPPFTEGNYVVRVAIYKDGKTFNAANATKTFTFKVNVD